MSPARCKTAILISGSGSNLQSFIDRVAEGTVSVDLAVVFSNRPDAFGLERARTAGIDTACIQHGAFDSREAFDRAVSAELDRWDPELLDRSDIRQHEFDTEPEAHAFRAGVQLAIDAALFCDCTPPLIVVDDSEDIVVH